MPRSTKIDYSSYRSSFHQAATTASGTPGPAVSSARDTNIMVIAHGTPSRLILSPSTALAQPHGWQSLITTPKSWYGGRFDEVHCLGGGSLLLWLLACAHCAPRGRMVYMHGPVVVPTPESCARWLERTPGRVGVPGAGDKYDWRRQAIALGAGGFLQKEDASWLEPLMRCVASGRAYELGARATDMQKRWERSGRLIHVPSRLAATNDDEDGLVSALLLDGKSRFASIDAGEAASSILRCSEAGCAVKS